MQVPRLRRSDRHAPGALRSRRCRLDRWSFDVAPLAVPRPVRPRPGRADDGGRPRAVYPHLRTRLERHRVRLARRGRGRCGHRARRPQPARRSQPAIAAPHRRGRPVEPRRLSRQGRLRRPAQRNCAWPRGCHPRGQGLAPDGPRRCRVPDRRQVGGGCPAAGSPQVPHLQRRRVRARHLQGSRDHGGRSVLARRVDDDRGVRDGYRDGLHLSPRRVSRGRARRPERDRPGVRSRLARR